jgi:cytochrome c oxidase cbb3-type subunit 2
VLKTNALVGVPYTEEQIANAAADLRAQSNPDDAAVDALLKRWPKAIARDFDGDPKRLTEMDALVAYLQVLGTMVDFKLYDDKANLR